MRCATSGVALAWSAKRGRTQLPSVRSAVPRSPRHAVPPFRACGYVWIAKSCMSNGAGNGHQQHQFFF